MQGLSVDTLLQVAAASGLESDIVPRLTAAILYHIHPMDAASPAELLAEGTILTALTPIDPIYTLAVSGRLAGFAGCGWLPCGGGRACGKVGGCQLVLVTG